jgi:hypothetical protein
LCSSDPKPRVCPDMWDRPLDCFGQIVETNDINQARASGL